MERLNAIMPDIVCCSMHCYKSDRPGNYRIAIIVENRLYQEARFISINNISIDYKSNQILLVVSRSHMELIKSKSSFSSDESFTIPLSCDNIKFNIVFSNKENKVYVKPITAKCVNGIEDEWDIDNSRDAIPV